MFNNETDRSQPEALTVPPGRHLSGTQSFEPRDPFGLPPYANFRALLSRRRGLVLSTFSLIVLGTMIYIVGSPRTYEAELRLLIKRTRADEIVTADKEVSETSLGEISETQIRSEVELLQSRTLLESVAEECYLKSSNRVAGGYPQDLSLAVLDLQKHLRVAPIPKTNLISVKYRSTDREPVSRVLKVLGALYLDKHTAVYRNHDASAVFAEEAARYREQLSSAEEHLASFERQHGASLLEEQKVAVLKRIAELQVTRQEVDSQIQDAEQRTQELEVEKERLPSSVQSQTRTAINDRLIEQLKTTLLALENKQTELLARYDPGYQLVRDVDQQIRDTRNALAREQTPVVVDRTDELNPLRQRVEEEILRTQPLKAGLFARRAAIDQQLNDMVTKQSALSAITIEHDELLRQVKISEADYLLYQKKQEESRISETLDRHKILNVSIVDEPETPALPTDGHWQFILLLGVLTATLSSLGAASIAQHLDPPVLRATEVHAYTGLPVLTTGYRGSVVCRTIYSAI